VRLARRGVPPPVPPPDEAPAGRPDGAPVRDRRPVTHAEHVMGTVVSFAVLPAVPPRGGPAGAPSGWEPHRPDPGAAIRAACALLHEADAAFSTWDPRTLLSRLRRGDLAEAEGPACLAEVRVACEAARDASGGWFDPWAMPGGYDPTGLVKGWAVDRALAAIREAGLPAALVNGGGDLAAFGGPEPGESWRAGIRHPWRPAALAAVLEVRGAVATSGAYERGAHLVDPRTGQPGCRAASATVTGPGLAMADALATALAVGGDEALAAVDGLPGYAGYLIRPDGTETWTSGLRFADR
jgi:thiamine biosynthesis lipoprotein